MRLIDLATESCPDEIINLASGIGYTIRDYATMICEEVGYDASQIEYDTTQYVGVEQKVLSTAKLRRIADFGFTDIRAGLAEVVADYSRRLLPSVPASRRRLKYELEPRTLLAGPVLGTAGHKAASTRPPLAIAGQQIAILLKRYLLAEAGLEELAAAPAHRCYEAWV